MAKCVFAVAPYAESYIKGIFQLVQPHMVNTSHQELCIGAMGVWKNLALEIKSQ